MPFFVGAIHKTKNACCQEEPSLLCLMVALFHGTAVLCIIVLHSWQMTRLQTRTVSLPSSGPAWRRTTCSTTSWTLRGRNLKQGKWRRHRIRQLVVNTHYIYQIIHTHNTRMHIYAHWIVHIIIAIQSFTKHNAYGIPHTNTYTHIKHHIIGTERY